MQISKSRRTQVLTFDLMNTLLLVLLPAVSEHGVVGPVDDIKEDEGDWETLASKLVHLTCLVLAVPIWGLGCPWRGTRQHQWVGGAQGPWPIGVPATVLLKLNIQTLEAFCNEEYCNTIFLKCMFQNSYRMN